MVYEMGSLIGDPVVSYAIKIVLGFLVGALIGLERERARIASATKEPRSLPGIRSFGLLSLYGTMLAELSKDVSDDSFILQLFVAVLAVLILILLLMYIYIRFRYYKMTGITTSIVMVIDISLGFMVGLDRMLEAIATSILVTTVLAIKPSIRRFVREVSYKELLSGLELGLFAFIIGPFFLSHPIVIYGIDISKIYLLFLMILILSFVSYIAVKLKGSEAIKYVALLGGLVNSEAAAVNIASILSRHTGLRDNVLRSVMKNSLYIIISAMLIRNTVIAVTLLYGIYSADVATRIVGSLLVVFAAPLLLGLLAWYSRDLDVLKSVEVVIENPLSLRTAIRVVVVYATIFAIGYVFISIYGSSALLPVSAIGGLVNAGAAILMVLTLSRQLEISVNIIASALLVANAAAIFNKLFFVRTVVRDKNLVYATVSAAIVASSALIIAAIVMIVAPTLMFPLI